MERATRPSQSGPWVIRQNEVHEPGRRHLAPLADDPPLGAYWLPDRPQDSDSCPCFLPSDTRTRPTSPGSTAAGARWFLLIGIVRFTAVTLLALRVS